jgi:VIT1/CCC1 family predicted Fe2+/Mn2+ transporter
MESRPCFSQASLDWLQGTLNLAIAQYVSVNTQYDIMTFQAKRNMRMGRGGNRGTVPSPTLVAVASSLAYLVGSSVPLLAAAFIEYQKCRFFVAITVACFSMFVVGVIGRMAHNFHYVGEEQDSCAYWTRENIKVE